MKDRVLDESLALMDPISAAGLVASFMALIGVVARSTRTIYDIRNNINQELTNAIADTESLEQLLQYVVTFSKVPK